MTPKNTHARTTLGILSTIRLVGLIGFASMMALTALAATFTAFTGDLSPVMVLGSAVIAVGLQAILAGVFYATIGWLTETLNMLTQIARNTAR